MPGAEADIEEIGRYLERVASQRVASSVVSKIRAAALKYCDFPFSARMIPEFGDPSRRETFVYQYRLMYRVETTAFASFASFMVDAC